MPTVAANEVSGKQATGKTLRHHDATSSAHAPEAAPIQKTGMKQTRRSPSTRLSIVLGAIA